MSMVYHDMGNFKESWILASQLPDESADKEASQLRIDSRMTTSGSGSPCMPGPTSLHSASAQAQPIHTGIGGSSL